MIMEQKKEKSIKKIIQSVGLISVIFFSVFFIGIPFLIFAQVTTDGNSDEAKNIQGDIQKIQDKITKEEKAKSQLEQNLNIIQQSVNSASQEIKKTQGMLNTTKENIQRKEDEINILTSRIVEQKEMTKELVREMYYETDEPVLQTILKENSLSQMMGHFDNLFIIKGKLDSVLSEMNTVRDLIGEERLNIKEKEVEQQKLLSMKQDQQQVLVSEKIDTQSDINEKDATIGELQSKLGKLRSDLSDMLGGSFNASDIEDAAKFAARATGVRKDFIMGMLVVESDLGRFTGGCYAKDSRMSGTRLSLFKDICEELDYNWAKRKVSCPPKGYKGTGGAMGVAQFMADTWVGYKSSITSVTGNKPPDPWNLADGVAAMALKLSKVSGVTSHKRSGECNAAKLYLSGTTSSKYQWYCDKVLYWSDNYQRLLD
jgi:peptidoglycan hydrolase CwlO-like protein